MSVSTDRWPRWPTSLTMDCHMCLGLWHCSASAMSDEQTKRLAFVHDKFTSISTPCISRKQRTTDGTTATSGFHALNSQFRSRDVGMFPWSRSMMLGSAKSEHPRLTLTNRWVIFEEFLPPWSRYRTVTNRQTDRQTTYRSNTALCIASRGKMSDNLNISEHVQYVYIV